jgi:membrane protein implicated in regulation of membrane protease activity
VYDWVWWLLAAFLLAGLEVLSTNLVFIMLAGGAAAASIGAGLGLHLLGQVGLFVGVSAAFLLVVRPVAIKHLRVPAVATNFKRIIGAEGIVLAPVDGYDGRVKVAGEIWSARTGSTDQTFEVGTTVHVTDVAGATVIVGK